MGFCLCRQLLDISELDMVGAGREAKRRRKTLGAYWGLSARGGPGLSSAETETASGWRGASLRGRPVLRVTAASGREGRRPGR